jgi:hypothetical protein
MKKIRTMKRADELNENGIRTDQGIESVAMMKQNYLIRRCFSEI